MGKGTLCDGKEANAERPYKAWRYPLLLALYMILAVFRESTAQ
jgi:hypothetical protein